MTFLSCLTEEDSQLVLDSSAVINLLATGQPISILSALALPVVITDNVILELEHGHNNGRQEINRLADLIASNIVRISQLDEHSIQTFFDLVSGSAAESLGDGEAATLAFAYGTGGSAVIDERKATRLSAARFSSLRLVTTIDILAHDSVRSTLGQPALAEATFQALRLARMQVREHQFDWIVDLIGYERAAACSSLKRLLGTRAWRSSEKKRSEIR